MSSKILQPFERLSFVDHNVRALGGHHHEFILSVMGGARRLGLPAQFLVDRRADPALLAETGAVPVFSDFEGPAVRASERPLWRRFPRVASPALWAWQNWRFGRDLEPCFARLPWDRTLLVVPHCSQNTLVAMARALRGRLDSGSRALLVFFTYPSQVTSPFAFRTVAGLVRAGKVILGTDSAPLSEHYQRLTGLPFHVLPMPYQVPLPDPAAPLPSTGPLRLLAPGEMRAEKGSDVLVAALADLHEPLAAGRLGLTFQTYLNPVHRDPVAIRAREQLLALASRYPPGAITLIDEPLASDAYHDLLARCDAAVMPYRRQSYAIRSSGVLMESLALGKPIVTTAGTWLELQMQAHGVGFGSPDGDAPALAAAIRRLLEDFPRLARDAVVRREAWRNFHNPENYLEMVCALGRRSLELSKPVG